MCVLGMPSGPCHSNTRFHSWSHTLQKSGLDNSWTLQKALDISGAGRCHRVPWWHSFRYVSNILSYEIQIPWIKCSYCMNHSPCCVVWPHTCVVCVRCCWNDCQRHLPWIIFVHTAGLVPPANCFHPSLLTSLCHLAMLHPLTVLHWHLALCLNWQITK